MDMSSSTRKFPLKSVIPSGSEGPCGASPENLYGKSGKNAEPICRLVLTSAETNEILRSQAPSE